MKGLWIMVTLLGLVACATAEISKTPALSGNWRVISIEQQSVNEGRLTMQFAQSQRVAGSSGCNQFSATLDSHDGVFMVTGVVSTQRACVPALAEQEQHFLTALKKAAHYQLDSTNVLTIRDANGTALFTLAEIKAQIQPMKPTTEPITQFDCTAIGVISMRFVGPETIMLSNDNHSAVLRRTASASGAQYVAEKMTFWNKKMASASGEKYLGDSVTFLNKPEGAIFGLNGQEYACKKRL